jgi:hypothetical protein
MRIEVDYTRAQGNFFRSVCDRQTNELDGSEMAVRKIVHIDLDAFYASVEQRNRLADRRKSVT